MVETTSTMMPLGAEAPDFTLPDVVSDDDVSLDDFADEKALLVIFLCRHCPFVQHIKNELARIGRDYEDRGLGVVAISANDADTYADDSPESLREFARETGFNFPLCHDETQEVAKAYRAACTPDFFLFDENRELVYRGQLDDSRPGSDTPVDGSDLRSAIDAVLAGEEVTEEQKPSIGCNIKWKPGNEPEYFRGG
jgi:peroxiredoxin